MITKNLVVKIQNLAVNDESRPVKLNPASVHSKIIRKTMIVWGWYQGDDMVDDVT